MTARDDGVQAALEKLLTENGLDANSRLYREALRGALTATGTNGVLRLAANPAPSESVIDVYGQGYVVQAEEVGPGLAFAESARPNWQETMEMRAMKTPLPPVPLDRVEVEVRLEDILLAAAATSSSTRSS